MIGTQKWQESRGSFNGSGFFIGTLDLLESTWEAQKSHSLASTFTDSAVCELQPTLFVGWTVML